MIARRLSIHGRVQGVFYRQWTVNTATDLGLHGWVRNRSDRTVEVHVEGNRAAMESFIEAAQLGPPMADVTCIEVADAEPSGLQGFKQIPSI